MSEGYSKIVSVEVTNFMVYDRAKLVFDDSNIVNIKGYNSSGKSSMLKAIGVCLTNMFPKAQTKLIKHGKDYFRIVVTFSDGISILRDKYANGQSLYEMFKHGECIFTTKEGKRLSKVDDVPAIIKDYLGLCETSFGYLNYQSRQDKLWLVETTGSENYCTLNEILRSEEIARASALINSDKNKLSGEITAIEAKLQGVKVERMAAEAYTPELLEVLRDKETYVQRLNQRAIAISRLKELKDRIEGIVVYPEVSSIDANRLNGVTQIASASASISAIKLFPVVSPVDGDRLSVVSRLASLSSQMQRQSVSLVATEIPLVAMERANSAIKLASCAKRYFDSLSSYRALTQEVSDVKQSLEKAVNEAEKEGKHFVKCSSCGSFTVFSEGGDDSGS